MVYQTDSQSFLCKLLVYNYLYLYFVVIYLGFSLLEVDTILPEITNKI